MIYEYLRQHPEHKHTANAICKALNITMDDFILLTARERRNGAKIYGSTPENSGLILYYADNLQ